MAIVLAIAGPVGSSALGQRLNLESAGAPEAGTGAAALGLAETLDRQIDGMRKRSGAGPASRVSIALRVVARDLLLSGEAAGEAGSARVLTGRTIADHLAALDARVGDGPRLDALALATMAKDLEAGPPQGQVALDRWLRDVLAPMTQTAGAPVGPAGWFEAGERPGETSEPLVRWSAGLEMTDPLREAITTLDERLHIAQEWVAYHPTGRRIAGLVREAARPLQARPAWMTAQARRDLEDRLIEALARVNGNQPGGEDESRDPASLLRRLAMMSGLIELAGRVDDTSPGVRELRAGLLAVPASAGPSASEDRRLATFERALRLAVRRRDVEQDADVVRQLKPALRALGPAARESESAMMSAVKRLLTDEGAATDPAVLNAISAHQRRVDDLALVADLNRLISTAGMSIPGERPVPGVAAEYRGLADWLFAIGQDLSKPARRDLALAELREVAGGAVVALDSGPLARLRGLVDPNTPRPAGPDLAIWNDLTQDRAPALVEAAGKVRAGLVAAWSAKDVPRRQEADRRARQLNRVVEALEDAAWYRSAGQVQQSGLASANLANLQQWPGWQLSPAAMNAVGDGLAAACRAAVDRLVAGEQGGTEAAVRTLETRFAVALLAGRLSRLATQAGLRAARPGPSASLLELGLGPPEPRRSWMAEERAALAAVCRYAEEWAAVMRDPKQAARATAVRIYLDGAAARLLERVRASE